MDLYEGAAAWDFELAARASAVLQRDLVRGGAAEMLWGVDRGLLLDAAVVSWLKSGDPDRAHRALHELAPLTTGGPDDFRVALLRAHIVAARSDPKVLANR